MHKLIELDNVNKLLNGSCKYGYYDGMVSDVGGFAKSLFKFRETSVCEVFGYQIASAIGVRVPKMQGVWTKEYVRCKEISADPGRIGILVDYHEDWKIISRDHAVEYDPKAVVSALVLCVFDLFEWGEFALSNDNIYFADLERLLPRMSPEVLLLANEKDRTQCLHDLEIEYSRENIYAIDVVLKEARRLGLQSEVEQKLQQLCLVGTDGYYQFIEISGHPLDKLLSRFAIQVFGNRLNSISKRFKRFGKLRTSTVCL